MVGLKILGSIYPLIKDALLDGKSIREAAMDNQRKLIVLAGVMLSIFLNIIIVPRIFTLSDRIITLEKRLESKRNEIRSLQERMSKIDPYDRFDFYKKELDQYNE